MKAFCLYLISGLFLFFAPIKGIILLVALSTLLDTGFGVWRAKKTGVKLQSKVFRHGLVPKLLSYCGAVMLLYASDFFIINDLMNLALDIDFLSTKLIAIILISIEVKSMDESFEAVKGYSFIKKITGLILKAKDIKKDIDG